MSCETFTTEINGHTYSYTQLPATKSLALKYKLIGLAGGAIGELTTAIKKNEKEQMQAFSNAMQDVFSKNDPEKVLEVVKEVLRPAFIDGQRIDIDRDFTGDLATMYKVLFWILGREYENFIKGLGSLL